MLLDGLNRILLPHGLATELDQMCVCTRRSQMASVICEGRCWPSQRWTAREPMAERTIRAVAHAGVQAGHLRSAEPLHARGASGLVRALLHGEARHYHALLAALKAPDAVAQP